MNKRISNERIRKYMNKRISNKRISKRQISKYAKERISELENKENREVFESNIFTGFGS